MISNHTSDKFKWSEKNILKIKKVIDNYPKGKQKSAEDYFLAGKSLPWWTIGASLIAANISAEQFIGMSGSGFALGLAIASYEWMAAITLLIVGKYFLPNASSGLSVNILIIPLFSLGAYGIFPWLG